MLFNEQDMLEEEMEIEFDDEISTEENCSNGQKTKKECAATSVKETDDVGDADSDVDVEDDDLMESMFFDDAFDVYNSVCESENYTHNYGEKECSDQYEEAKKDAFAFGPTNDQVDSMIDIELSDIAQDTIPDNVNILGANTDDFEYDEDRDEDMDDDEDIDIVIDDDDDIDI